MPEVEFTLKAKVQMKITPGDGAWAEYATLDEAIEGEKEMAIDDPEGFVLEATENGLEVTAQVVGEDTGITIDDGIAVRQVTVQDVLDDERDIQS